MKATWVLLDLTSRLCESSNSFKSSRSSSTQLPWSQDCRSCRRYRRHAWISHTTSSLLSLFSNRIALLNRDPLEILITKLNAWTFMSCRHSATRWTWNKNLHQASSLRSQVITEAFFDAVPIHLDLLSANKSDSDALFRFLAFVQRTGFCGARISL